MMAIGTTTEGIETVNIGTGRPETETEIEEEIVSVTMPRIVTRKNAPLVPTPPNVRKIKKIKNPGDLLPIDKSKTFPIAPLQ